jgi:hypothetical protein
MPVVKAIPAKKTNSRSVTMEIIKGYKYSAIKGII